MLDLGGPKVDKPRPARNVEAFWALFNRLAKVKLRYCWRIEREEVTASK